MVDICRVAFPLVVHYCIYSRDFMPQQLRNGSSTERVFFRIVVFIFIEIEDNTLSHY